MRRSALILIGLGTLLIVIAALVRFVVAPNATRLPDDTDSTTTYSGTGTFLNAQALQSGDMANALARDIPVTLDRHVYVSQTDGNTAIVHDDGTLKAASTTAEDKHTYAVDRKELTETSTISGVEVEKHEGLTITLPVDPEPKSGVYKYWDTQTLTAVPVTYVGSEERDGRKTYHYRATATGPLAAPELKQQLPVVLPKSLAPRLLPLLPADVQAKLAPVVAGLPDLVELGYTATSTYDVFADAELGAPLDIRINRSVVASVTAGSASIPLLPVLAYDVAQDKASVSESVGDIKDASRLLGWISLWIPLALLVVGLVLIVLGVLRRKPRVTDSSATPSGVAPTTVEPPKA
ncbi:MAG TPA: porin PorA family protein [Kribbella sp.]|nr:porin PorA family protein [Kribbella sp.]